MLRCAVAMLLSACLKNTSPGVGAPVELWISASATPGGDGSNHRPFTTWPSPLPDNVYLHLLEGTYTGPLVLPPHAHVVGNGHVVIESHTNEAALTTHDASVERLDIRGELGMVVAGQLVAEHLTFHSGGAGTGIVVEPGASLKLTHVSFEGPWRKALTARNAHLVVRHVSSDSAHNVVHAIDSQSTLEDVDIGPGEGPALFFSGGTLTLRRAHTVGHEYSLQLFQKVDAHVTRLQAEKAAEACLLAVGAKISVHDSSLRGCGSAGALALLHSQAFVDKLAINEAHELGVFVRQGSAVLRHIHVDGVSAIDDSFGDGFHIRDAEVEVDGLKAQHVRGSGLFATASAHVRGGSLFAQDTHEAALFADRGAMVELQHLHVERAEGPAVVIPSNATVRLGQLSATRVDTLVAVDCDAGARLEVKQWNAPKPPPQPCIR